MSVIVNNDDDSFIILGTSPGTSLDLKCNEVDGSGSLNTKKIEDAVKDLSLEAGMAFKAHFQLGECPSPASMMTASTIITDDKSTEELQKQFGELLDENVILKETLKKNNESMKEQFLMIASCQEDMMKTHEMHKEKFDETKELVEKLRQENKKLKMEISRLAETERSQSKSCESVKSGPMSALEFVTSPDDDTINKLTSQLDLVEKQRRQVIVENEKLTWQKESLEHIIDATSKERDDLKEKMKNLELQLLNKEIENKTSIDNLNTTIHDLYDKLQAATVNTVSLQELNKRDTDIQQLESKILTLQNETKTANQKIFDLENNKRYVPLEEINKRDAVIRQLEGKIMTLQHDLKTANLKIFELENLKLEISKQKAGTAETVKMYKEQIQELNNRLKEAQSTVFQPVRFLVASGGDSTSEYSRFTANVKLYDRALKHLAELLNSVTHGLSQSLVETLGLVASLHDFKLERSSIDQFKSGLSTVKQQLEKQHSTALSNTGQVRGTMTIFEGIFKDHSELLKKVQDTNKPASANVEALTAALVARGQELQTKDDELKSLRNKIEDCDILKAQLELYKSDFEAEREARETMASEKEIILTDLRTSQRRLQDTLAQLEEVRKLNPMIFRSVQRKIQQSGIQRTGASSSSPSSSNPTAPRTSNMIYTCPKCLKVSSPDYKVMEDHFDDCLDDF